MGYDPNIHHRRSVRLKGYDYSANGAYFVTICTEGRERLFGGITNDEMLKNEAAKIVEMVWRELPERFPGIVLDKFVVMPNHFHGIILLSGCNEPCVRRIEDNNKDQGEHKVRPYVNGTHDDSLGRIMQAFKSLTTVEYTRGVARFGWPPFPGRLWQRNYYERIIRDEKELANIREYIIDNPARWEEDPENPHIT